MTLDDVIRACGALPEDASLEAVDAFLERFLPHYLEADRRKQELLRQGAISTLRKVKLIGAPTKLIETFLTFGEVPDESPDGCQIQRDSEELLDEAWDILHSEDQLALFRDSLTQIGYAGATEPAEAVFVGLHSRSMPRPLGLVLRGPSAAGKTHTIDAALRHHPPDAVHDLTACSERSLVYSQFNTEHAYVVIGESSALHRDGVGATIIRGLAWGEGIRYETVVKGPNGLEGRLIVKPGPTGLLTTSTKPLDREIATRLLEIHITDSPMQTRAIIEAEGRKAAGLLQSKFDPTPWHSASSYLRREGVPDVVVPFAPQLAALVPAESVRMRRDYRQVVGVVSTVAFMHQRRRQRDEQGRVIAEPQDYVEAHRLLAHVLAVSLNSISDATRETVDVVRSLTADAGSGVSYQRLADELGLTRSGAWRRATDAIRVDYLINAEERKGYPARLKIGDALPSVRPALPDPEVLFPKRSTTQHVADDPPRTAMEDR